MRMQDSQANCGPTAMSNALAALGMTRTSSECEVLCKTTATLGTSHRKLVKALRGVEGLRPIEIKEKRRDVALLRLDKALNLGRPVILCVGDGSHWVAAVGRLGDRFLIADSADNELVLSKGGEELAAWWDDSTLYYGVIL